MHEMKKLIIVLIALYLFPVARIFSQTGFWNREKKEHSFILSGVPQFLASNGLRINLDIQKKNTAKWFIISPYLYYDKLSVDPLNLGGSDTYFDNYSYKQMLGAGLGLGQRIFLSKKPISHGVYIWFSGTYKYFNISGDNGTFVEYVDEEDGLTYQHIEDINYTINIHQMSLGAVVGYQFQIIPTLYIDPYIGFGIKYSFHNSPQNATLEYNRGVDDYGFTGTHISGGIRFGFGL